MPVDENRAVGGFKIETEDGAELDTSNFLVLITAEKCASVLVDIRDLEILMEVRPLSFPIIEPISIGIFLYYCRPMNSMHFLIP